MCYSHFICLFSTDATTCDDLARQRPRRVFGGPRERGISAAANGEAGTEENLGINK
jgi:hypothetical protein